MSDTLKRLGRRVRHVRSEKKFSQERLAEQCGISTKYVSDLERGLANVSIQVLERVAFSLNVSVLDLLDNGHEVEREVLVQEISSFLQTTSDEKVKIVYRVMKGIS